MSDDLELNQSALDILDRELDDIEDLPGFECPVNGNYLLKLSTLFKKVNEKQAVEAGFEVMECIKQDNETEPPTVVGTKFSQLFYLEGEPEKLKFSIGALKKLMKPLGESSGNGNLLFLCREYAKDGILIRANVKGKQDKENPEIRRPRVEQVQVQ